MNVNCPGCNHLYRLDENRIPPAGQKMRCPKCTATFRILQDGTVQPGTDTVRMSSPDSLSPSSPFSEVDAPALDPPPLTGPGRSSLQDIDDTWGDTFGTADPSPPLSTEDDFSTLMESSSPPPAPAEDDFSDLMVSSPPPPAPTEDDFSDLTGPPAKRDSFTAGATLIRPGGAPSPSLDDDDPFAAADLPTPKDDDPFAAADLPTPKDDDPFAVADFPAPKDDDPFAVADFPAPKDDDPFGMTAFPPPSGAISGDTLMQPGGASAIDPFESDALPSPNTDDDPFGTAAPAFPSGTNASSTLISSGGMGNRPSIPDTDDDFHIPSPADLTGSDGGADRAFPGRGSGADFGNIDFAAGSRPDTSDGLPSPASFGGGSSSDMGFGQLDLGGGSSEESAEFDAFPVQEENTEASAPRDQDTLDLAADIPNRTEILSDESFGMGMSPPTDTAAAGERRMGGEFEGRRKYDRQSRKLKAVLIGFLALLGIGGGALHFTNLGAFGVNRLIALLPSATAGAVIHQFFEGAVRALDRDTVIDLNRSIDEIQSLRKDYPMDEDLRLIGVYLHNIHQLRYGLSKEQEQRAIQILGNINLEQSTSRYAKIASASRLIVTEKAQQAVARLSGGQDTSPNEAQLLTMAYLRLNQPQDALKTIDTLLKTRQTPRTVFLRQLSLVENRQYEQAMTELDALLKTSPNHWDARILRARILVNRKTRDTEAVTALLTPVNDAPAIQTTAVQKAQVHSIMGKLLFQRRRFDTAKAEFEKARALNPSDVTMLIGLGDIALMEGDLPGAGAAFRNALTIAPRDPDARLGNADLMIRQDKYKEAREIVTSVLEAYPDAARAHLLYGLLEKHHDRHESAETALQLAIEKDPEIIGAYVALSDLYMKTNRRLDAMKTLDAASEAIPDSSIIKLTLADGHASNEDFASAIIVLNEALTMEPENPVVHFRMAQMYRRMEAITDAQNALDEVARISPDYPGLSVEQGFIMELTGKVEEALRMYEKILEENPSNINAKTRAAAASMYQRNFDRAKGLLVEVLNENPDSADGNFYMGEIFRQEYNGVDAVPYLKNASELDANNPLYHIRYGAALTLINDFVRAMTAYRRAMELDPKIAEIYLRIGELRLRSGAARDAIQKFEKALSLDPRIDNAHLLSGKAYEELSNLPAALDYYQKATVAFPDNAEAFYRLGLISLPTRGPRGAVPAFQRAVRLAEAEVARPVWLHEALYHLGISLRATGNRRGAIDTFQRYLEIAPENAIDRKEVLSLLDKLLN